MFDTNRLWCSKLPLLTALFPETRGDLQRVPPVPWILDSLERLVRRNRFELSKIFNFEPGGTVYSRVEGLGSGGSGLVGFAWNALREARYFGEDADRLLLVSYETLTGQTRRRHSTRSMISSANRFMPTIPSISSRVTTWSSSTLRLGTPWAARCAQRGQGARSRATVLPPDLFKRYEGLAFWQDPAQLPTSVRMI